MVLGSANYGQATGTVGNTAEEVNFWQNGVRAGQSERNIIPINMLRSGEKHKHPKAQWVFGQGFLMLSWPKRTPVPENAVRDILRRVGLEPVAVAPSAGAGAGAAASASASASSLSSSSSSSSS